MLKFRAQMGASFFCSMFSFILMAGSLSPTLAEELPAHAAQLGAATYVEKQLNKLRRPALLWADFSGFPEENLSDEQINEYFGYAAAAEGETNLALSPSEHIIGFVDGSGGVGLNDNFGSGRAATVRRRWQIKGSGRTVMVNLARNSPTHANGAAFIGEGIHEAIWGALLAHELPYGAARTVALIATGSEVASENLRPGAWQRVLIVRQDPLRPAHYVLNGTAQKLGGEVAARDWARVEEAMKRLFAALPSPPGPPAGSRAEQFRDKVFEFIDRQAIQHGYGWAHGLFHAATSPSNAGLDGALVDFGTQQAYDGYPKHRVLDDDGYFGETAIYKRDLLKDVRDSWVLTLPADLRGGLPSEREWFARFESTFQRTRRQEMLRLAGAFTEFSAGLEQSAEGHALGQTLIALAAAGNDQPLGDEDEVQGTGTYRLGEILRRLADLQIEELNPADAQLSAALPDPQWRSRLIDQYRAVFRRQRELAADEGISPAAEAEYRRRATAWRNKKRPSLFRTTGNEEVIWALQKQYLADHDPAPIRRHIEQTIAENRREFRDAAPFTLVEQEARGSAWHRVVFDARATSSFVPPACGRALKRH